MLVGLDIGFFEYHFEQSNIDEEEITHTDGCVSLNEDYFVGEEMAKPVANKPNDLIILQRRLNPGYKACCS